MAHGSTAESIYLEVRFAVLSGQYRPGQLLERDALAEIYECKPRVGVDALNVLLAEGYLDHPKRGMFCVRTWRRDEIDDLIDISASMMGMAAAKVANGDGDFMRQSFVRLAAVLVLTGGAAMLGGCSSKDPLEPFVEIPPEQSYNAGIAYLQEGDYKKATEKFGEVDAQRLGASGLAWSGASFRRGGR